MAETIRASLHPTELQANAGGDAVTATLVVQNTGLVVARRTAPGNRHRHEYSLGDPHAVSVPGQDRHRHSDAYRYPYADSDRYTDAHAVSNPHRDPDATDFRSHPATPGRCSLSSAYIGEVE